MNIEGVFIPTIHLIGLGSCMVGMLLSTWTKSWNWFSLFTFLGFCLGMGMFFKFLGS